MRKQYFCECLIKMREYAIWERDLYRCGFDMAYTPITGVLGALARCMCDFNDEWAYDEKEGLNWIVEWACGESPNFFQKRHGREWNLTDVGTLYDFLVFMNERGWYDELG